MPPDAGDHDWSGLPAALPEVLGSIFERFDADGDGVLTTSELQSFAYACNNGEVFEDDELEQIHTFFETTAAGALTRKGFFQMIHTQTNARPKDTATDLRALGGFELLADELEQLGEGLEDDDSGDGKQGLEEGALFEHMKRQGLKSDPELIRRELERKSAETDVPKQAAVDEVLVSAAARRLLEAQRSELGGILLDIQSAGPPRWRKKGHWAWYVWPTNKVGFSDPLETAVEGDDDALYVLACETTREAWRRILLGLSDALQAQRTRRIIPEIDHGRIRFFAVEWTEPSRQRALCTHPRFASALSRFLAEWEAAGQEAAGQEAAGQEAARQEAAGQEAAGQEAAGQEAAGTGDAEEAGQADTSGQGVCLSPLLEVRLHGLTGRAELNGLTGLILGPLDASSGRWPVRIWGAEVGLVDIKAKGANLHSLAADE